MRRRDVSIGTQVRIDIDDKVFWSLRYPMDNGIMIDDYIFCLSPAMKSAIRSPIPVPKTKRSPRVSEPPPRMPDNRLILSSSCYVIFTTKN